MKIILMDERSPPASPAWPALPLQQSPAYGGALTRLGAQVTRVGVEDSGRMVGFAQLVRRGWGHAGLSLLSRGPVWAEDAADEDRLQALSMLARTAWPLVVTGALPPGWRSLRLAADRDGAVLPVAATAAVQLALMDGKWRNRLRRGLDGPLGVVSRSPGAADLVSLHRLDADRQRSRGYRGLPPAFTHAVAAADPGAVRLYLAQTPSGETPAAALILLHAPWASYHIAWSANDRPRHEGPRLILWQVLRDLADRGFTALDLGIADPRAPGLLSFKRGTGARIAPIGPTALVLPHRRPCGSPDAWRAIRPRAGGI